MIIKSPCIIDISHWEVVDWPNLDSRVRGVLFKLTQGKSYRDPTAESSWLGAKSRGLPRGPFHFMEENDVAGQVENFLTASEDVGIIVSGKWMAEIPPVLDGEITPRAPGTTPKPVVGAELAGQHIAWISMVNSEVRVMPWLYSSRSKLNFMKSPIYWTRYIEDGVEKWDWMPSVLSMPPAWAGTVPLWLADYNDVSSLEIPDGWTDFILWQYRESEKGEIQGIGGSVDLNVFNGTEEEWLYLTGGAYHPPEPPSNGENDMSISIATVLSRGLNVRSTPNSNTSANLVGPSFLRAGDLVQYDRVENYFAHLKAARRGGVNLVLPPGECWAALGETNGFMRPEWKIDVGAEIPTAVVELDLRGANVDGAAYLPDRLDGTKVVFKKAQ